MTNNSFQFSLLKTDGGARRGRLNTAHGVIETPGVHACRDSRHGQGDDS
jgi:hypothetical protein